MKKPGLMILITCCAMVAVIGCNKSETVAEAGAEAAGEAAEESEAVDEAAEAVAA